jgi:LmbE family N-acetylglucosaminyl deacetylase
MISANQYLGFKVPVLGKFPNLRMNTINHIDIVKFIEKQILKFKPNRIFTHHPSDINDDHFQVSKACLVASRLFQRQPKVSPIEAIYFMEILSSTDWSFSSVGNTFKPDTFSDITKSLNKKLNALSKYKYVMRAQPHPRSKEVLTGHAAYRGGQCSYLYAEAFQTAFRREI